MAKNNAAKSKAAETASQPRQDAQDATPGLKEMPRVHRAVFDVALDGTCGHGTIRPAFRVEIHMNADHGGEPTTEPIDADKPGAGLRIAMPMPSDPFAAGIQAREKAVDAFNRFYGINATEHTHNVDTVEVENPA